MDVVTLVKFLNHYFNAGELRNLCVDLGIDYESLEGSSKSDKARELVLYCERHGLTDELIAACKRLRPRVTRTSESEQKIAPESKSVEVAHALTQLPYPLESPEGTMRPDSPFYVERSGDSVALRTIRRQGETITIKGPRQVGKSSLLMQVIDAADTAGKRIALLDFQRFGAAERADADTFFRQFCLALADELELDDRLDEHWRPGIGNIQRCSRYLDRYVLKEVAGPLLMALDEIDSIIDSSFRSDFFGMLRNWHNTRASKPIWRQLDMVLVTSTEPYQLVENLNQSPFNVGEVIELSDFSPEQIVDLNRRHGVPFTPEALNRLVALLGGHPFLVRLALYKVADGQLSADRLFATASTNGGPFDKHLQHHLRRLRERPELIVGMREVVQGRKCDPAVAERLQSAGLVQREGQKWVPRCQLYADYFRERL